MADDRKVLIGKWTVRVKDWLWEYEFSENGAVTWRDTRSLEKGSGRWSMGPMSLYISWSNSPQTKESWQLPLSTASNKKAWYSAPYYTGPYQIEKRIDDNLPKTEQQDPAIEIESSDPRLLANYIDKLCTHVGFGIYLGGFYVYVPPSLVSYPILVPANILWFGNTGQPQISDQIFEDQASALQASGGKSIAYYKGVAGQIICPTAFTMATAPTIVTTAGYAVDDLIDDVKQGLGEIIEVLTLRISISTAGAIISRSLEVRRLKARDARAKSALDNLRQKRLSTLSAAKATTIRPKATPSQLREMLQNPDDWYVWATQDSGIIENQQIDFRGKTNFAANQKVHLLKGTDGIRGVKYGQNKVAIKVGSQHISHFSGNEYLTDPIPAGAGVHFYHSDLSGL